MWSFCIYGSYELLVGLSLTPLMRGRVNGNPQPLLAFYGRTLKYQFFNDEFISDHADFAYNIHATQSYDSEEKQMFSSLSGRRRVIDEP